MLGFDTPQQLLIDTPPQDIVDAYESFTEDGAPLDARATCPAAPSSRASTPEPLLVRAVHRDTGEERWRVIKATPVAGRPALAVNVIEDITEVKRAEHAQRFLAAGGRACWPPASTTSRRSTRIAELAVPRLADWCSVSLPARRPAAQRRRRARRPGEASSFAHELPGALPDARSTRRPAPRRSCATAPRSCSTTSTDELLDAAIARPRAARGAARRSACAR